MCKVLIIPAIKEHRRRETEDFIMLMGSAMSKSNSDGLGYAAIDAQGNLFGERWFVNSMAFNPPPPPMTKEVFDTRQKAARALTDKFGGFLKTSRFFAEDFKEPANLYNNFGETVDLGKATAITLHTRMATCEKGLKNVHPFVDQDTSVIHNGVISNKEKFDLKLSTCDSESILISYLKNQVNLDPEGAFHPEGGVQGMANELEGYYATGVFSRNAQGERILDVFKMNNNNLSICYIYDLETYVMSTSDHDIREACKALGYTHDGTIDLNDGYLTRINPFTGEVMAVVSFTKKVETKSYMNDRGNSGYRNNGNHHNRNTNQHGPTNVLPYSGGKGKSHNAPAIDAAMFKMLQLKSSITEMSEREVQEFQVASGLWD